MKYASSIRFGGQLIDAKDCDYEDYKRLGLLCPECKDPVFLKAEGTRQQAGKEVRIGAHFSHFATKNPELAKVCENRVKGYTQADVDRAVAKAKGQRLKLLQRWFWSVLNESYEKMMDFSHSAIKNGLTQTVLEGCSFSTAEMNEAMSAYESAKSCKNGISFDKHWALESQYGYLKQARRLAPYFGDKFSGVSLNQLIDTAIDAWQSGQPFLVKGSITANIGLNWPEIQFFGKHKTACDWNAQRLVAKEVLAFILSKKNREMLSTLVACIMAESAAMVHRDGVEINGVLSTGYPTMVISPLGWLSLLKFAQVNIVQLICAIPWADEFARLSAESKVGAT